MVIFDALVREQGISAAARRLGVSKSHISKQLALLETALGAQGVHRPPGTTPLRHAENLVEAGHQFATEVHDITQVYLSVRFGGDLLTDEDATELEARVREIRQRAPKRLSPSRAPSENAGGGDAASPS